MTSPSSKTANATAASDAARSAGEATFNTGGKGDSAAGRRRRRGPGA
jgi:hypothetical protein